MNMDSSHAHTITPPDQDKAAYESLVGRHYKHVFAVCLGMLANVHDAEDAAQETMLKGFVKMKDINDQQRFGAWIVRVARNLCIDHLRRRNRQKPPAAEAPAAPSRQDENALGDLEQAVGRLPMELRVPLLMYYFDGRSAASIAEHLNMSHATTCLRLRKARRQLHELMTERIEK